MGMNLTEKILSEKNGKNVKPKDYISIEIDVALANDITAPIAIEEFYKVGLKKIIISNK